MTKPCSHCKTVLPLDAFHKNSQAKDNRRPECKDCTRKNNGSKRRETLLSRFWANITKTEECWLWMGCKSGSGYGKIKLSQNKKIQHLLAHRLSFELHNGPIPLGLFVCHSCDIRHCVNPSHLWLGTSKDNMQDAARKGRTLKGERHPSKTSVPWIESHRGENNCRSKLTTELVRTIKNLLQSHTPADISMILNVSRKQIYRIKNGNTWRHVTI